MMNDKDFGYWKNLFLGSPDEVFAGFKELLAGAPAEEAGAAIAYLPDRAAIADVVDAGEDWVGLPLAGVPFLVKDLYDVAGWPTAASSRFLASELGIPATTSPLVESFLRLGATPVGKTHLNEFAYGLSGRNLHFGNCRHPLFSDRLTGGSSSGSAWAVGKGLVPLALGTDTGGSVRVPAAFCGVYGIRLVPGEWSGRGCFPLSPSLDTAGWFTATGEDMRTSISLMLEPPSTAGIPKGVLLDPGELHGDPDLDAEYGVRTDTLGVASEPSVDGQFRAAIEGLLMHYSVLVSREAFAVHEEWIDRYRDLYSPAVWQRIDRGRRWSVEEIEATEDARRRIRGFFEKLFSEYDYAVLPATMVPAPREEQLDESFRNQILTLTSPASMAATPVLTVPVILESGLSGGLQIIYGDPGSDLPVRFLEIWD